MRARTAWLAGAAGAAVALYRRLRRPAEAPVVDPRAAELRQKLDESRGIADERDAFESGETPVDQAEPAAVEDRRRAVHERGRAAAEHMRGRSAE